MKFKKGDKVESLDTTHGQFTKGRIYTVSSMEDDRVFVIEDDYGGPNSWLDTKFKLSTKSPVSFMSLKNSITLHYDGKTKVIAKEDKRFDAVLSCIREKRLGDIPDIADNEAFFEKQGIKVKDGVPQLDGNEMPKELNDRLLAYRDNNLPVTSLLAFWNNLKQNPSFNSRQQLFKFLENKGHSLTEEGYFVGYRGVTEDFKDKHSNTFDNRPGSICEIPRSQVDDNPANTCSHGLHVGGYEYAKKFGPKLVLVKVNPKDVVAVPNDYNGQKMRVCRFEVIQEIAEVLDMPVFGNVKPLPKKQYFVESLGGAANFDPTNKVSNLKSSTRRNLKRYANNHAKRGKDGKFITKTKSNRLAMANRIAKKKGR